MTINPNLEVKPDQEYYSRVRTWPSLFDITRGAKILDVGCGKGKLGAYLQRKYDATVTGLEIIESNFVVAASVLHSAHLGDIESMNMTVLGTGFDYVIFSDSLEHMLEPQMVLESMKAILAKDGRLLISMPNVRNFRVTVPLLFSDQWEYQDEGLLDRTHLRFFTRTSISNLLLRCGYEIEQIYCDLPKSSKVGMLNIFTFGLLQRHLTSHYFIKACTRKY